MLYQQCKLDFGLKSGLCDSNFDLNNFYILYWKAILFLRSQAQLVISCLALIVLMGHSRPLFRLFSVFAKNITFLQQCNVKSVHPASGAGI